MVTKIGIDLGYANIALSDVTADVHREPSVVLIDKNTRHVVAIGNKAAFSNNEGEANGMLVRPFKNGLLYSSDLTREIIYHVIKSLGAVDKIRCVIATPSDFLPKQEQEVFKMMKDAGVDECFSVKPAIAALVGAGYSPAMSAVSVNIGASFTEIAVVHQGEIIISKREQVGGEDFDQAVKQYILEQGDMTVSLLIARTIKERLGAVWEGKPSESIEIDGVLALTGNKIKMGISTEDIVGVFEKPLQRLLSAIASAVKKIPFDKVEDIFENGIVLTGGGAELYGLDTMINAVLGIPVVKPDMPIDSVAKGLSRINSMIPPKSRVDSKDVTYQLAKLYETNKKKRK